MKLPHLAGLLSIAFLAGCAHGTMRGSVAMKISETEAHVGLGDQEVKVGDKIILFKHSCIGGSSGCRRVKVGEGEIIRTLNHHYSVARINPGVSFEEGTIVEKN